MRTWAVGIELIKLNNVVYLGPPTCWWSRKGGKNSDLTVRTPQMDFRVIKKFNSDKIISNSENFLLHLFKVHINDDLFVGR